MVFTIEPMMNAGKRHSKETPGGWTDSRYQGPPLSAQWEHMVAVTETGFEVLALWPAGCGEYLPLST